MVQKVQVKTAIVVLLLFPSAYAEKLTLEDCIKKAKENNPQLIQAGKTQKQTKSKITYAESSYYPRLSFSNGYKYNGDSAANSYSTNFSLSQSIYEGGSTIAKVKIARLQGDIVDEEYKNTESDIVLSVKESFFTVLQKEEEIKASEKILERRKENLALIELKFKAGLESDAAKLEAEADLFQTEYNKVSAEEELLLTKIELNLLLGRDRGTEISVSPSETKKEFEDRRKLISDTLLFHPKIKVEKLNKLVKEATLDQIKSDYYPDLSLSMSYGWQGDKFFPSDLFKDNTWNVGLSLSLPIFEGFATNSKAEEAGIDIEKQDSKVRDIEQKTEKAVETAYSNWILAKKKEEVSAKKTTAARKMYELTKLQYQLGKSTYLWLQQREIALTNAEYELIRASFNVNITEARLERAMGK